tara:strand:- start:222 stop:773 length:552 start_codon:yes stop_codon:yes gene_type:complete
MELMDAETLRKRKNRLLLYDDSTHDARLASRALKIKAMQELKPLYPWSDRFSQGSFLIVSRAKGKRAQIDETTDQLDELNDLLGELLNAQADRSGGSYAGIGNEKTDIEMTLSKGEKLLNQRLLEQMLVEENTNNDLSNAIKNLRPDDKTPDNYTINNMNMMTKAEYLVETLGFGEAAIKAAF